jgi:ACT domain-containing protein
MPRRRYKPEEIVAKLRQVDVLVSQGQNQADAIRQIGVSEVTYYRWRQEFGGLKTEQIKRLKELELENNRLRKAVSDLTLDKLILQEAARGSASTASSSGSMSSNSVRSLHPARRPRPFPVRQRT